MLDEGRIAKTKECIRHYLIGKKLGVDMGFSAPANWILTNWDMGDDAQQSEYRILLKQVIEELGYDK